MKKDSLFSEFTQKYALSKTLRFELKPVGRTREHLEQENILIHDAEKAKAYKAIKPLFDEIHEDFIRESLSRSTIHWDEYLELFTNKDNREKSWDEQMKKLEEKLRKAIGVLYEKTAEDWKDRVNPPKPEKEILKEKWYNILTESGILKYLKIKFPEQSATIEPFEGFFTYFSGFNQNRENYYSLEEKSTAVANRIVGENLPKFCSNITTFRKHQSIYLDIYGKLDGVTKQIKDRYTGNMVDIYPITEDIFNMSYFNQSLTQEGIEKYNSVIGHYNELINLYNQKHHSERVPQFKILFKQIGAKGGKSFEIFTLKSTTELRDLLEKEYFPTVWARSASINELFDSLRGQSVNSLRHIFLSKIAINTISSKYFSNWMILSDALSQAKIWKRNNEGQIIVPEYTALADICEAIDTLPCEGLFRTGDGHDEKLWTLGNYEKLWKDSSRKNSEIFFEILLYEVRQSIENITHTEQVLKKILPTFDIERSEHKEILKSYADASRVPVMMLKYFLAKKIDRIGTDAEFYNALYEILDGYKIFEWYDAIRNFVTKKTEAPDKMKLNFENSTLAAGWDVNKESANTCGILRDENDWEYLAVMNKKYTNVFEKDIWRGKEKVKNPLYTSPIWGWKKMEYKLLPGPNKMLPKCLIPGKDRTKYGATEEILTIYDSGVFKKSDMNFSKEKMWKLIDFYKDALRKYEDWRVFDFSFLPTREYEDIGQFYLDVEKQWYKLDFKPISKEVLDALVDEGKVFLFQIKNRDYNDPEKKLSGSKKNLHTLYWQSLFAQIDNRPKLNGEAELFYRKWLPVSYKKDESGKEVIWKNGKKHIAHKRYSEEKFLFHVPITLNFCLKETNLNEQVHDVIQNKSCNTIGIDRGEKHLLYYSITDTTGNILEQGSLNEIVPGQNYNEKLSKIAKDRDEARKSWQKIGTIKEMKEWYISQAVRRIVDLALQYDALVVMEDLNTGFKRGRQKIEKSLYQKFELALAKKLNYLVNKDAEYGEPWSVNNAYQLTYPVSLYGDIEWRKQVGILLYTRANYTSQTDPITGWRKSIYLKKGVENIRSGIIEHFSDIRREGNGYVFEYIDKNSTTWQLRTMIDGEQIERYRGKRSLEKNIWEIERVDIHTILDDVFAHFDQHRSLYDQIESGTEPKSWESLRYAIELIQQIRNTGLTPRDDDFLLSPVSDTNGVHYDSRTILDSIGQDETVPNQAYAPSSGDANGAYNIARKGVIMTEHIRANADLKDISLYISDQEWDLWLTNRKKWQDMLPVFASKKAMEKYKNKK